MAGLGREGVVHMFVFVCVLRICAVRGPCAVQCIYQNGARRERARIESTTRKPTNEEQTKETNEQLRRCALSYTHTNRYRFLPVALPPPLPAHPRVSLALLSSSLLRVSACMFARAAPVSALRWPCFALLCLLFRALFPCFVSCPLVFFLVVYAAKGPV